MNSVGRLLLGGVVLAAALAAGQASSTPKQSHTKTNSQKTQDAEAERGQQVFDQNCARCHQAPEGFSPSISGTVTKHMRVRAGLSDGDTKALLKFFNP